MKQRARGEAAFEALHEVIGEAAFGRPQRLGVPFRAVHVINAHEGWLAAHREPAVAALQLAVEQVAE